MKKFTAIAAIVTLFLATSCHNPNSSTAQEPADETPVKTESHGGGHGEKAMTDTTHAAAPHADSAKENH